MKLTALRRVVLFACVLSVLLCGTVSVGANEDDMAQVSKTKTKEEIGEMAKNAQATGSKAAVSYEKIDVDVTKIMTSLDTSLKELTELKDKALIDEALQAIEGQDGSVSTLFEGLSEQISSVRDNAEKLKPLDVTSLKDEEKGDINKIMGDLLKKSEELKSDTESAEGSDLSKVEGLKDSAKTAHELWDKLSKNIAEQLAVVSQVIDALNKANGEIEKINNFFDKNASETGKTGLQDALKKTKTQLSTLPDDAKKIESTLQEAGKDVTVVVGLCDQLTKVVIKPENVDDQSSDNEDEKKNKETPPKEDETKEKETEQEKPSTDKHKDKEKQKQQGSTVLTNDNSSTVFVLHTFILFFAVITWAL